MNEIGTCGTLPVGWEGQAAFPGYSLPSEISISSGIRISTSSFTGIEEIWPDRFRIKPTPMFAVDTSTQRRITSKPILVSVHSEGECFVAENEALGLYGIGDTQAEAIEKLKSHILYFYQYYKKLDVSQLIGEAIKLKALYDTLFLG